MLDLGVARIAPATGQILHANSRFAQIIGRAGIDPTGSSLFDLFAGGEMLLQARLHGALHAGAAFSLEREFSHGYRTSRWVSLTGAPATKPGAPRLVAVEDVSERKRHEPLETELQRFRENLEQLVLERTQAVDSQNGELRDEILERERSDAQHREFIARLALAQEEERRRISRDLHDQVGQQVTALQLALGALRDDGAWPAPAHATLVHLQQLADHISKEIHDLALVVRPTSLDDLGLLQSLTNFVDDWSGRAKVEVDFHASGWEGRRLTPVLETTIFRILCEAFNNVLKHASARRVSLIVDRRHDHVAAIVEDDGRGFALERGLRFSPPRLGLIGMRERALLVGGDVKIESAPGRGTTVFVRIPISPANSR